MTHRINVLHIQLYLSHVQYTQGLEEKSPFSLAELYMHVFASSKILGEGIFSLCCKGAYSLNISVINDQIESS